MDIHIMDTDRLLAEDVAKAHVKDLKVEDRHGVKQLKYWVDTDNKKVFCLMIGPNKGACHAVHEESHGMTACNIVELSKDEGDLLLVGDTVADLAYANSGRLDSGVRTLLRVDVMSIDGSISQHLSTLKSVIKAHEGAISLQPYNYLMSHFYSSKAAIDCAEAIKRKLQSNCIEYTIGVISGHLLSETSKVLFEEEKKKLECLAMLGLKNNIYIDTDTLNLLKQESEVKLEEHLVFSILSYDDLFFLQRLKDIVEQGMDETDFTIAEVNKKLGLSKASVYRAINSLLGTSPTDLIQRIRLKHAFKLLAKSNLTMAEVAYQTGFNSPSYFTRVFKSRFGVLPSDFRKVHKNA